MTPLLDTPSLSLSHDGGGQRDMKSTPGGGGEGGGYGGFGGEGTRAGNGSKVITNSNHKGQSISHEASKKIIS